MQKTSDYSRDSIRRELDKFGLSYVKLSFFEEITSTNTEMKKFCLASGIHENPFIFAARRQTAGRGRLGKSFVSEDAGLYMSLLLPGNFGGAKLTAYVAVLVSEAIEELSGISTDIKWVNDIYVSGRKLAGILCEGIVNNDSLRLDASIVGIGINVLKTDFPEEISDIAVSLEEISGKKISRAKLLARVAEKLLKKLPCLSGEELIEKYQSKSNVLGKTVKVTRGEESFFAKAVDINENAELVVVKDTGETLVLNSGDVSIKLS